MTSRRTNQRHAYGQQHHDSEKQRPSSTKGEGYRSANEPGATEVNRPRAGQGPATSRQKKNQRTRG